MKELRPTLGSESTPEASVGSTEASVSSSAAMNLPSHFDVPDASSFGLWNFDFTLPVSLKRLQCIDFNTSLEEVVFAEIFAGSGNLSESVRNAGLTVHAIDSVSKRQSGVSIHVLVWMWPVTGPLYGRILRHHVGHHPKQENDHYHQN